MVLPTDCRLILHTIGTGQSGSRGVGSGSVIDPTNPNPRAWRIDPDTDDLLVPAVHESTTQHVWMVNHLHDLANLDDNDPTRYHVGSLVGQSGTGFSGLFPGNDSYTDLEATITAVKAEADSLGARYVLFKVDLTHGEEDSNLATPNYRELVHQYRAHITESVQRIAGQTFAPAMLINQVSSRTHLDPHGHEVATDQLLASLDRRGIYLTRTRYDLPYGDAVHHGTPEAYAAIGHAHTLTARDILRSTHTEFVPTWIEQLETGRHLRVHHQVRGRLRWERNNPEIQATNIGHVDGYGVTNGGQVNKATISSRTTVDITLQAAIDHDLDQALYYGAKQLSPSTIGDGNLHDDNHPCPIWELPVGWKAPAYYQGAPIYRH